ncbi:MAG TPA: enoyl-CoA hydratase/isomerase family protein [Pedococcus sp.]|jgi:enoyl-CoA hydratase/carnithine racemase|uniref:enoyl-CoA hydratase/isomerase family protein n=1 Tax=Pedococcus sp. TaxID=2860345 RepID=UPI002F948961
MDAANWWSEPYEDLRVEAREAAGRRIAVVTFDLPGRRNSMSAAMTASWVRVMASLRSDADLAAVVVTGAPPAFNAGGDLSWIVSEPDAQVVDLRERMLTFYRSWLSIKDLEVPTIAAINGHAIGAGFALALACDIRYAAADARMGVPFTSLGLHPGMATTWSLPDVGGPAVARDLLLTGRIVTGQEAVALGLVSLASPAEEVLGHALEAAERVAAAAPIATRLTLQAVRDGGHASYERALEWEALAQAVTLASEDLHEGIAAASERRRPTFHGR